MKAWCIGDQWSQQLLLFTAGLATAEPATVLQVVNGHWGLFQMRANVLFLQKA